MSDSGQSGQVQTTKLTPDEREWIRRQGVTARVLAKEQRSVRARLSAGADEVQRVRELLHTRRRFRR